MRAPIDIAKPHCLPKPPSPKPPQPLTTGDDLQMLKDLSEFRGKDANKDEGLTAEEMYGKGDGFLDKLTNGIKQTAADKDKDGKVNTDEYLDARKIEREKASKIQLPGLNTGLGKLIKSQVDAHHKAEELVGHDIHIGNALESLGDLAKKLKD